MNYFPKRYIITGAAGITLVVISALAAIWIISRQNLIRPSGIVIHHSAVPSPADRNPIDAEVIDHIHERKGYGIFYWGHTYHIGYHYVILPDGTLQHGRPETCQGAHTSGHNDKIGICLIGEFTKRNDDSESTEPRTPTPEQLTTLDRLIKDIATRYDLRETDIYTHHQLNPATECPGENFGQIKSFTGS